MAIKSDILKGIKEELGTESAIIERVYTQTLYEYMESIEDIVGELEAILKDIEEGTINSISNADLEHISMKLPVLMYRLGGEIERVGVKLDTIDAIKDFKENDVLLRTTGTVGDKKAKSENSIQYEKLLSIIQKRVYKQIDRNLDYADKIYNSLKKVMTLRIAELDTFRRENAKNNNIEGDR